MRILSDGAEGKDPVGLWDLVNDADVTKFDSHQHIARTTLVSISPRTGQGYYALWRNYSWFQKNFADNTKLELFVGCAVYLSAMGISGWPVITFYHNSGVNWSNNENLYFNADGSLTLVKGSGNLTSAPALYTTGQWYYIEWWYKPLNVNGRSKILLDGVTIFDYTGDTTDDREWINAVRFAPVYGGSTGVTSMLMDDIVINDVNGAVNNTFPGMVKLLPIRPHSPGTDSDWTRAGVDLGSDEAQAINGTNEFTKLQTANADDLENFVPDIPDLPAGATITNIIVSASARVQAGAGVIAPMVIANATPDISADQTLVSGWRTYQNAWALNPEDAAAWDEADLALLKIGVSS